MPPLSHRALALFSVPLPVALGAALIGGLMANPGWAQDRPDKAEGPTTESQREPTFDAQRRVTQHIVPLAAGPLAYSATAEFLPLRDGPKEELAARIFTVSYRAEQSGASQPPRPVTFVFNGGPGAASAYMHLGAAGPRVVTFAADGALAGPPARLIDNSDTWLAFTDLVFVDPVGTGYSRATKTDGDGEKRFWSVEGDAKAMAEVVRLWLTRNERWSSPTFLAGESYGGFRIAKMADELIQNTGLAVNGLILVSPVVDFASIDEDGLLATAFKLPAMAATAAAFGRAPGTPEQAAQKAEEFAMSGYLTGLAGLDYGRLDQAQGFFTQVAGVVGLPVDLVVRQRGRVPMGLFTRELLRADGRVLSIYDGTFTAADPDPGVARLPFDPFLKGTVSTYTTAFAGYAAESLGVRGDLAYRLLSDRVNRGWEWPRMSAPNATDSLQTALTLQPSLRVLIAHGRTDLITPYMASRWIAARLELPPQERDRVRVSVHEGGHMMYTRATGRAALAADARALIEDALRAASPR